MLYTGADIRYLVLNGHRSHGRSPNVVASLLHENSFGSRSILQATFRTLN